MEEGLVVRPGSHVVATFADSAGELVQELVVMEMVDDWTLVVGKSADGRVHLYRLRFRQDARLDGWHDAADLFHADQPLRPVLTVPVSGDYLYCAPRHLSTADSFRLMCGETLTIEAAPLGFALTNYGRPQGGSVRYIVRIDPETPHEWTQLGLTFADVYDPDADRSRIDVVDAARARAHRDSSSQTLSASGDIGSSSQADAGKK